MHRPRQVPIPITLLTNKMILAMFWDYTPGVNMIKVLGNQIEARVYPYDKDWARVDLNVGAEKRLTAGFCHPQATNEEIVKIAKKSILDKSVSFQEEVIANNDEDIYERAMVRLIRRKKEWGQGRYAGGEPTPKGHSYAPVAV